MEISSLTDDEQTLNDLRTYCSYKSGEIRGYQDAMIEVAGLVVSIGLAIFFLYNTIWVSPFDSVIGNFLFGFGIGVGSTFLGLDVLSPVIMAIRDRLYSDRYKEALQALSNDAFVRFARETQLLTRDTILDAHRIFQKIPSNPSQAVNGQPVPQM